MQRVRTFNKIAPAGLEQFPENLYRISEDETAPTGILVRSAKLHDIELPESLLAIARAGAGTNNIPIERCAERGIVVFNTPGANANGVKELTIMGLLMASRNVYPAMTWVQTIEGKGKEVPKLVEKEKSRFAGREIRGKKLGLIGLGAIGIMVANDAQALGMEVAGYDPYLSVDGAWRLSRSVKRASSLEGLLAESDYISLHLPLIPDTEGILGVEALKKIKRGVKVCNFSRGALVDNGALIEAIKDGRVNQYITDFPEEELLGVKNVLAIPHLGASTHESEENCAVMAVRQLREYLEQGNIRNSVNFPNCELSPAGKNRLCVAGKKEPSPSNSITEIIGKLGIGGMVSRCRGDYSFTIIDVNGNLPADEFRKVKDLPGVISARIIENIL